MRKVIFEISISVDGFIEGPRGELDWRLFEEEIAFANKFLEDFDTIFYGRIAYEKLGIAHPTDAAKPEAVRTFKDTISMMRKYVFSRTIKHVAGNGMIINHYNIEEEVKRIRDEDGKNIWLCGGANILSTFIDLDLIDEYQLAVQPKVLGAGKPLFKNITDRVKLKHIETKKLNSGIALLCYQPESRISKPIVVW